MRSTRRGVLKGCALTAVWLAASAHTPYRQWKVYRRKHLLLLAHRGDARGYELAKALAGVLRAHLPDSEARVARGPHLHRVASLIATDQMQFAVLRRADALTMARGAPPLEAYGAVDLTTIADLGTHLLVARADVPDRHAWLLAEALAGARVAGQEAAPPAAATDTLPAHPGARAHAAGRPLPALPAAAAGE